MLIVSIWKGIREDLWHLQLQSQSITEESNMPLFIFTILCVKNYFVFPMLILFPVFISWCQNWDGQRDFICFLKRNLVWFRALLSYVREKMPALKSLFCSHESLQDCELWDGKSRCQGQVAMETGTAQDQVNISSSIALNFTLITKGSTSLNVTI